MKLTNIDKAILVASGLAVLLFAFRGQDVVPAEMVRASKETGKPVYVTVTTERPGRFVAVSLERPELEDGQACIVGRVRGRGSLRATAPGRAAEGSSQSVDFPQIAQYFASAEEAHRVEGARGSNLLANVATSRGCNAQLVGLEPGSLLPTEKVDAHSVVL